jgi:hypothetical protein
MTSQVEDLEAQSTHEISMGNTHTWPPWIIYIQVMDGEYQGCGFLSRIQGEREKERKKSALIL